MSFRFRDNDDFSRLRTLPIVTADVDCLDATHVAGARGCPKEGRRKPPDVREGEDFGALSRAAPAESHLSNSSRNPFCSELRTTGVSTKMPEPYDANEENEETTGANTEPLASYAAVAAEKQVPRGLLSLW
jgi:hypothetical protein